MSNRDKELEEWRRRIDVIDEQLLRLINSRSACAIEIGRIKRSVGLPVYSPEREAWILDRVMRENPGPLDAMAIRRVFERIIDESRRLERIAAEDEQEGERLEQAAEQALHRGEGARGAEDAAEGGPTGPPAISGDRSTGGRDRIK